jgi:hypothetical protein
MIGHLTSLSKSGIAQIENGAGWKYHDSFSKSPLHPPAADY